MKKKFLSVMSVMLVTFLLAVSLTGCGTTAKATDQKVTMDEETIIVTDEESSEDIMISTEDEITETEVTGEVEDKEAEVEIEEDIPTIDCGYLVIYDKVFKPEIEVDWDSFNVLNVPEDYTFTTDTNVYGTNGELVGYVKAGSEVTFNNRNDDWFRFNPNAEGVTYPYLMVRTEDLKDNTDGEVEEIYKLSPEEVEKMIIENIEAREIAPTFLDAPDSDMKVREFTLWNKRDELSTKGDITKVLHEVEAGRGDFTVADYLTFYVECTGDEERVDCRVYYKDKVEE